MAVVSLVFLFLNRRFLKGAEMKFSSLRIYALVYLAVSLRADRPAADFRLQRRHDHCLPAQGFTLQWFSEMFANPTLGRALRNSLIIAISSAIWPPRLGIFAARAGTRFSFPGKGGIMGLIMLPLVLPEIIVAMSLLVVLLGMGVDLSIFTVILGHILIATPYADCDPDTAFASLDRSRSKKRPSIWAKRKWSTFRLITLPLVMPGLISSFLISFTICWTNSSSPSSLRATNRRCRPISSRQLRFPKQIPIIMALGTVLVLLRSSF